MLKCIKLLKVLLAKLVAKEQTRTAKKLERVAEDRDTTDELLESRIKMADELYSYLIDRAHRKHNEGVADVEAERKLLAERLNELDNL